MCMWRNVYLLRGGRAARTRFVVRHSRGCRKNREISEGAQTYALLVVEPRTIHRYIDLCHYIRRHLWRHLSSWHHWHVHHRHGVSTQQITFHHTSRPEESQYIDPERLTREWRHGQSRRFRHGHAILYLWIQNARCRSAVVVGARDHVGEALQREIRCVQFWHHIVSEDFWIIRNGGKITDWL